MKVNVRSIIALLVAGLVFAGCVKKDYDSPPDSSTYDPNVPVNLSLSDLNKMAVAMSSGQYRTIGDSVVWGVVVADDRSGNFYKQLVIEDSTGGMTVLINQTDMYTDYPIGRKIYLKLKGLILVNYNGLPQVAYSATVSAGRTSYNGIPAMQIKDFIVKATYPATMAPIAASLFELTQHETKYLNRLVAISDMQFDTASANKQYAAPSYINYGTARYLKPCPNPYNLSLQMYNSGFSTFQPAITPNGRGTLVGIFSKYNSTQFLIRDTSDVQFAGSRGECF